MTPSLYGCPSNRRAFTCPLLILFQSRQHCLFSIPKNSTTWWGGQMRWGCGRVQYLNKHKLGMHIKRSLWAEDGLGDSGAVWQRGIYRLCMCQQCLFLGVMGYMHPAVCTYAYRLGLLCNKHTFSQHFAFAYTGSMMGWCSWMCLCRCVSLYQHVNACLLLCTSLCFLCCICIYSRCRKHWPALRAVNVSEQTDRFFFVCMFVRV